MRDRFPDVAIGAAEVHTTAMMKVIDLAVVELIGAAAVDHAF
jgi:hypothetical protein